MEGKREGAGCSHSQRVATAACWQVQGSSSGPSRRPPTGRQRLGQVVLEQGIHRTPGRKQTARMSACHSGGPATELGLGSNSGSQHNSHGMRTSGRASREAVRCKERVRVLVPRPGERDEDLIE